MQWWQQYRYLLPTMYLFMADITNPDLFVYSCRTWICLDITRFYEDPHGRLAPKTVNLAPLPGDERFLTQFAQQFLTAVAAPPLVYCAVWSICYVVLSLDHFPLALSPLEIAEFPDGIHWSVP